MKEISLFEIPIYRSDGEDLNLAYRRRAELDRITSEFTGVKREEPVVFPSRKYNDVVGWIHMSIFRGRIRAEYWFVEQRVVIGLRNKSFEFRGKLFTYKFGNKVKKSEQIYLDLGELLRKTAAESFPKRVVDYSCFEGVGRFINWENLLREYAFNHAN